MNITCVKNNRYNHTYTQTHAYKHTYSHTHIQARQERFPSTAILAFIYVYAVRELKTTRAIKFRSYDVRSIIYLPTEHVVNLSVDYKHILKGNTIR